MEHPQKSNSLVTGVHLWTPVEEVEYKRRCRLEEIFRKYDIDKSGTLEENELIPLVRDAFLDKSAPINPILIKKHTATILFKHDTNKSGNIDFEEFVTLYNKLLEDPELPIELRTKGKQQDVTYQVESSGHKFERPQYVFTEEEKEAAITLFNKYDKDNSHSIEKNELKELLKEKMGKRTSEAILNRFVEAHFSEFDKEDTGSISMNQFLQFYKKLYCNPTKAPPKSIGIPMPMM